MGCTKTILCILLTVTAAGRVQTVEAQRGLTVRPLGSVIASSPERYASASGVRELSDGRVLLNDVVGRRVVLLDTALRFRRVVADSTPATQLAYGRAPSALFPYKGDSSLFVSPSALALLVIDPSGAIVRVMAVPRTQDLSGLSGGSNGLPGFDQNGRLIYRKPATQRGVVAFENGEYVVKKTRPEELRDSTPLVRFDFQTRRLDTLTFLAFELPSAREFVRNCTKYILPVLNPLAQVDDWAVLSDGAVAVVRGRTYRVEWISADLTRTQSGRLQFNWMKLDEQAKAGFLDSTQRAFDRIRQSRAPAGSIDLLNGLPATLQAQEIVGTVIGQPGKGCVEGAPRSAGVGRGSSSGQSEPLPVNLLTPDLLPDYPPAFGLGSSVADRQGRVWVRTNLTLGGGSLYDVIDRVDGQVERVLVPPGRVIVGFGARGRVFMAVRDSMGVRLEAAMQK
jgi:hypothetical protein